MRATVSFKFHWKTVEGENIPQSNEARANLAPTTQMLRKKSNLFEIKIFLLFYVKKGECTKAVCSAVEMVQFLF
jgi:hypothetical protein